MLALLLLTVPIAMALWGWVRSPVMPIRVGALHALTGVMTISEQPLVDALGLAVEQLNAKGGLLGRPVELVVADTESEPARAAAQAERLIAQDQVSVLFGCWTSTCRIAVKPVVERHQHLMFYSVQYEGLEQSPNIIYTGAAPNQQIIPGARWAMDHLGRRIVQTERVLALQEARYRTIFGSMNDGVALLAAAVDGQDFVIVDANAAALRIIGRKGRQVRHHLVTETLPGIEACGILAALRDVYQTGDARTLPDTNYKDARLNLWVEIDARRLSADELMLVFRDSSERRAAQAHIEHLARHDRLTGLFNRYTLETRLDQALLTARRNDDMLAVMFIDLDRFKTINDSMGHHVGDQLLVEVARRLLDNVRGSDIVARQGGDEFVMVLCSLASVPDIVTVANKIHQALVAPYELAGGVLHTSPSIGISVFPSDGQEVDILLKNADTAMYAAKDQGRNNIQYFTAAMTARAAERLELERDLRVAIEAEQFELFYQPQVRTVDHTLCGVEAMIRWHHPERGLIGPALFIGLVEETGLILPIGRWVIAQACRQRALWRAQGIDQLRVAVNVSAHQLRDPELVQQVSQAMQANQLREGDLELEVTESVAMSDPQAAITQLQGLRALGITLAIDDFGTGYSSLAYLKRLPIQVLKLDREFVRDIESDPNDAAISAATLALAHSLGLQVVAEGVETQAQRDFLAQHQCDVLQGYLFGRPESATTLSSRMRDWTQRFPLA